jgi:hypothetical protein
MMSASERETEMATEFVLVAAATMTATVTMTMIVIAETETEPEIPKEITDETETESPAEIATANETTITSVAMIATDESANETAKDLAEIDPSPPMSATIPHAPNPDDPGANQTTTALEAVPPDQKAQRQAPRKHPRKLRKIPTHLLAKPPIVNASLGNNRIVGLSLRRRVVVGIVDRNVLLVVVD